MMLDGINNILGISLSFRALPAVGLNMKYDPGSPVGVTDQCVQMIIRQQNTAQRFVILTERILQLFYLLSQ